MSQPLLRAILRGVLRVGLKPVLKPGVPVTLQRRIVNGLAKVSPAPRRVQRSPAQWNGVAGDRWVPEQRRTEARVLFLHGGGYCVGSPVSHGALGAALASACGAELAMPDYRLAPEHPHPAALEDALSVYRALLAEDPRRPIILAGDSAGAGLALATAVSVRDAGLTPPAALVLMSPWVDLGATGGSRVERAALDPMLTVAGLRRWAEAYAGALPLQSPLCSPLHARLENLPPTLIQVGTDEVLFDDAERLQQALRAAGTPVELQVFPGFWHDFQLNVGVLDGANDAVRRIAVFITEELQSAAAARTGKRARSATTAA